MFSWRATRIIIPSPVIYICFVVNAKRARVDKKRKIENYSHLLDRHLPKRSLRAHVTLFFFLSMASVLFHFFFVIVWFSLRFIYLFIYLFILNILPLCSPLFTYFCLFFFFLSFLLRITIKSRLSFFLLSSFLFFSFLFFFFFWFWAPRIAIPTDKKSNDKSFRSLITTTIIIIIVIIVIKCQTRYSI